MSKRQYSYDSACFDLAEFFLAEGIYTEAECKELAQDIQDAVESWFRERERSALAAREAET